MSLSQLGDGEEEAGVSSAGQPRKTGRRREVSQDSYLVLTAFEVLLEQRFVWNPNACVSQRRF